MNERETRAEANRQIRMLMRDCTPEEQKRLKKCIKPVPESASVDVVDQDGPVHISEILPEVLDNISERREAVDDC